MDNEIAARAAHQNAHEGHIMGIQSAADRKAASSNNVFFCTLQMPEDVSEEELSTALHMFGEILPNDERVALIQAAWRTYRSKQMNLPLLIVALMRHVARKTNTSPDDLCDTIAERRTILGLVQ